MTSLCVTALPATAAVEKGEPSFPCSKATTVVEKRICQSPYVTLKKIDRKMAEEYRKALKVAPPADKDKLIAEQREWLKTLPACFTDKQVRPKLFVCDYTETQNPDKSVSPKQKREQCERDFCLADRYFERTKALQDYQESLMPPFRLEKDTGWAVCRDYLKSLETLNPKPESLACDLNIAPDMPQFSLPDWQELNIEEHWDIVYAIETKPIIDSMKNPPSIDIWRESYRERIRKGEIKPRLRQAKMRVPVENTERVFIENVEDVFYGYTRNKDNVTTCPKYISPYGYFEVGDALYYHEPKSNKLFDIYGETGSQFVGDIEHQALLHNHALYMVAPGIRHTLISRVFRRKPSDPRIDVELPYWAENICQIIARPTQTIQP